MRTLIDPTALNLFVTSALGGHGHASFTFGPVSADCVARVEDATGYDLTGFRRVLAGSGVRHVFKSHGDAVREAERDQRPVRKADFTAITMICDTASAVEIKGERKANKPRRLVYTAQIGSDNYEYVETIHPDKRVVALKTMRKW